MDVSLIAARIAAQCPDFGFFTPICDFAMWLVVPNPITIASEASSTISVIQTRFPFSYITNVHSALTTASTQTSSTAISYSLAIPYSATSSFGAYMPTSTLIFASSTVYAYGTPGMWTIMRNLMALAVYFGTIEMIYFGALKMIQHKNS